MVRLISTATASQNGVKGVVYGRAKTQKTRLALTATDCVIVDTEGGMLSLRQHQLPFIDATKTSAEIDDAVAWVASSREADQFQTVFLDSLTVAAKIRLAEELTRNKDGRMAYGEMYEWLEVLITKLKATNKKNIFFICQQDVLVDGMTGALTFGPSIPGQKFGPQLPYLFDEIFYNYVGSSDAGEQFQAFRTRADRQYEAGDRSGALDEVEPAHIDHVISKIKGSE